MTYNEKILPFTTNSDAVYKRAREILEKTLLPQSIVLHPDHEICKTIDMKATYTFEVNGHKFTGCVPEKVKDGILFDFTKRKL